MVSGADAVGAYLQGLDEDLTERFNGYRTHLQTQPLAAHTGRTYAGRAGGYLAWLAGCDPVLRRQQGDPFTDGHARGYTICDYRTHLITERQAKAASVKLTLSARSTTPTAGSGSDRPGFAARTRHQPPHRH